MADSRQSSAGVKNLRAMFENSAPTSPDSRGRSVSGNSSNGSSERPLSKVRSSFVAVQPSTAVRMSKSPQTGSPGASIKDRERRESFSLSEEKDAEAIEEIHQTISQEEEARRKSKDVDEVVPEQAIETAPPTAVATPLLAAVGKKPSPQPASHTPTKQNGKKKTTTSSRAVPKAKTPSQPPPEPEAKELLLPQPATPDPAQPLTNGRKADPIEPHTPATVPPSSTISPTSVEHDHHPDSSGAPEPSKAAEQPETTSNVPSTTRATSASTRTPSASRTTTKATPRTPSTQPNGSRNRQPSQARSTRSSLASTTTLPGNIDRGIGFVKPRPRSPTRPIKLPAHLVAPTASSASKVRGAETPESRVKSPVSPRHNGTPSLRSSVGSVRSPRPPARNAWGPPPKKAVASPKKVEVKREGKGVDRGFLERMMRPTASSAAKERGAGEGEMH